MVKVTVFASTIGRNRLPTVFLQDVGTGDMLPIVTDLIGMGAVAVALYDADNETGGPTTYDLPRNLLAAGRLALDQVEIYRFAGKTYFTCLVLSCHDEGGRVVEVVKVDSCPVDAIALAVRLKRPIFVADEVMKERAEDGDEVRKFLEGITPW